MRTLARIGIAVGIGMLASSWPARADNADDANVRKSVVKISVDPAPARPVPPLDQGASRPKATGSGVVIAGKRILTNAHVVNYASQIYVQPDKSSEKLAASVVGAAPGIDLAVLKLDDESFFDAHPALPTNPKLPDLKQNRVRLRLPHRGLGAVDHPGDRLADRVRRLLPGRRRACASRSTPRSTRATAAARPWSTAS